MVNHNHFLTPDTQLAAYLVSENFPLLGIQYEPRFNGKQRGIFIFNESPSLTDRVNAFNSGKATINLALYEHAKASLLDRVVRGLP
jgi:hypothetical protein